MSRIRVAYVCSEPALPLVAALQRAGADVSVISRALVELPSLELEGGPFDLVLVDDAADEARVAERLESQSGAPGRVQVVKGAVDPARFPLGQRGSRPAPPGVFTVGFPGPLERGAGLDVVAESFALMRELRPGFRLLVVGDGKARGELESQLRALRVAEMVEWTGPVPPADVPALLASMDAAVTPYPSEPEAGFPALQVYECMAAGLPVVASGPALLEETIHHGVNGLVCPAGDAPSFAAALLDLAEKPALRAALGREARRAVLAQHTWTRVAERLLDLARGPAPTSGLPWRDARPPEHTYRGWS